MRFRSWINIALLLAVAVVATVIYQTFQGGRLGPAPLTEAKPEEVESFSVEYTDDRPTMRLRGDDDGWRIVEPFERGARESRVVRILSFIDDRIDSCYEPSEERRAEFGLDESDLALRVGERTIEFGDRTQDGRRYVGTQDRYCLIDDTAYPLLANGAQGIAANELVTSGRTPVAIRTPAAEASQEDDDWSFDDGSGSGERWAVRWRSANASGFETDPPADDFGQVEIEFDDGPSQRWRLASDPEAGGDLILVPEGHDYGVRIAEQDQRGLVEPPPEVEDGLD